MIDSAPRQVQRLETKWFNFVWSSGSQDVFLLKRNPKACTPHHSAPNAPSSQHFTPHAVTRLYTMQLVWSSAKEAVPDADTFCHVKLRTALPASKNCDGVQSNGA